MATTNHDMLTGTDIRAFLSAHWVRLLLVPLAFLAVGAAIIAFSPKMYRSEAVLAPVADEETGAQLSKLTGQVGGLASLVGLSMPAGSPAATGVATLRSKELLAQFIADRQLLPELFAEDWDAAQKEWTTAEPPTLEDAVLMMDEDVRSVFEDKESGIVVLRVEWKDPAIAADWARQIVERANSVLRTTAIAEARSSMEYLERELGKTNVVELQNAIFRLMESQTQKIMIANVRPEYAFRMVDPPRVSGPDDHIWPNAPLIIAVSLVVGIAAVLLLGVGLARRRG